MSPSVIRRMSWNEWDDFQLSTLEMRGTNCPNNSSLRVSIADRCTRSAPQNASVMGLLGMPCSSKTVEIVYLEWPGKFSRCLFRVSTLANVPSHPGQILVIFVELVPISMLLSMQNADA